MTVTVAVAVAEPIVGVAADAAVGAFRSSNHPLGSAQTTSSQLDLLLKVDYCYSIRYSVRL